MQNKLLNKELAEIRALLTQRTVLTFQEGCQYTGYSEGYMYKLTAANLIPHSQPNDKNIFFDRQELDKWMLGGRNMTKGDVEDKATTYISKGRI